MTVFKKKVFFAIALLILPSVSSAQSENSLDAVMKRAATSVLEKYINGSNNYKFVATELPANSTFYTGETEMMNKIGMSVPGMLSRRLVKFSVEGPSADRKGEVVCDVDFRHIEKDAIWVFFYGCKYNNPLVQSDWEDNYYGKMPIRTLWDNVQLTAEEKAVLKP